MKRIQILLAGLLFALMSANAQVAITDDGSNADASAFLDIKSSNKGLLIPRIDFNNRPASPALGLMIYVTANGPDGDNAFYFYDGSRWSRNPKQHYIGENYGGGIVFWVDETGEHGLITTTSNQTAGSKWHAGSDFTTVAFGDGPGAGKSNTTIIIASQGQGNGTMYAARVCNELKITQGGKTYADWYLPSKEELNLMYNNLYLAGLGNFDNVKYWSSTESTNNSAWYQDFGTGTQWTDYKSTSDAVRAIRAF
jgi:hypothetical protein